MCFASGIGQTAKESQAESYDTSERGAIYPILKGGNYDYTCHRSACAESWLDKDGRPLVWDCSPFSKTVGPSKGEDDLDTIMNSDER